MQDQVSINGIPNYEMPQWFVEEEFKLLDDNEDEDEDASENDENDEFDLSTDTISCWAVIMIWSNFIASFFITPCISPLPYISLLYISPSKRPLELHKPMGLYTGLYTIFTKGRQLPSKQLHVQG